MLMIYFHAKFPMPHYNGSLVIVMKPKAKKIFYVATILLFYILQKYYPNKQTHTHT
jgi:hypothetical protein